MNSFRKNIENIAEEILEKSGFFLIDILIRGNENDRVIELFIDGEENITAKDCSDVSREIIKVLDENKIIPSVYRLDISSPGIDRPLQYIKQYPKHLNRKFDLTIKLDNEKKKITGVLKKIDGNKLTFLANEEVTVCFEDIIKAKVLVSFS